MKKRVLANGLTVILANRPTKTATLLITVKAGSNFEAAREKGVSHFIEHMLFEGTKTRSAIDITSTIEGIGGEIGAYTSNERTCYYVKMLPTYFRTALDVLFDVISNPAFRTKDIEKERKIILNEINLKHDEPRFYQWEIFLKTLFQRHPASFPISGTMESVQRIDKKAIVLYYQTHYVPNNMTVVYSGPEKDVIDSIARKFSALKTSVLKKRAYPEQETTQRRKVVTKEITQSYLVFGHQTVSRNNMDSYALDVIRALLGKGLSGRIVHEIRTQKGLAYEVGCHHEANFGYGFFAVYLNTHKKNLARCESIVRRHLDKVKDVSKTELEEAKNFLEGEFVIELEENQKYADAVAFWDCCGLGIDINNYVKNIRKVTNADIRRVAERYFTNDYAVAILKQK